MIFGRTLLPLGYGMRHFRYFFCVLVALLGASPNAAGQRFALPYTHYTIRDGLAQQQVRAFLEDSRGYIWIGTNGGLTRFDGRTLVPFLPGDSFLGTPVSTILEASDGSIWYSSGAVVYRFDGRTETALPMTEAFWQSAEPMLWTLIAQQSRRLLGTRFPALRNLSDQYLVLADSDGAAIIIDWKNRQCHRCLEHCETTQLPADFPASGGADNSRRYVDCGNRYYTWASGNMTLVADYLPKADSARVLHPLAPAVFHFNTRIKSTYWYRSGDRYRRLQPGAFNRIDKIFTDSQGRIYVATDEGFAVHYPDGPERVEVPGARYPWSVLPDSTGAVWIGSYLDGVLRVAPGCGGVTLFPLPEKNQILHQIFPGKLRGPDGALLFGGYRGFYFLRKDRPVLFRLGESIEALAWNARRGQYLAAGNNIYCIDRTLQSVLQTIQLPLALTNGDGLSALDAAPDGTIWAGGRGGVAHIRSDGGVRKFFQAVAPCIGLLTDANGIRWAGCGLGLFRYDPDADGFLPVLSKVIRSTVNSMVLLPGNRLAVVTDVELLLLDISTPATPDLIGYWTHTNGFQLLEASENGSSYDGACLWIPAGTGIQRLCDPITGNIADIACRLRVDRLGGKRVLLGDTIPAVETDGSAVDVDLSLINLSAGRFVVEYQCGNADWKIADDLRGIHITGLEHGANTIRFRVRIHGLDAEKWPGTRCVVTAALPVFQRMWFKYLFAIIGVVLVAALFYSIRKSRQALKLRGLLHQTRLSTAQAQMNPHIFFNLLSSLQNSIANRSKGEASAHLVRLARLMRDVLELSMPAEKASSYPFPTISVANEIAFLENYLSLEAMQHEPPFRYAIRHTGPTPAEALVVPPLLVQPLVENAVLHGIRPLVGRAGSIQIRFGEVGDFLIITVEDDGVGIDAAAHPSVRISRYRSRGSELLKQRLQLIGKLGFSASISVHPRSAGGTVAEIRIKKMYAHHPD